MVDKEYDLDKSVKNNVCFLENASSFRKVFILLLKDSEKEPSTKNILPLLYLYSQTLENFF